MLYFNARSLSPKLDELRVLCDFNKPEIVCITETWLCDDISLTECSISGYNSIRCDRHRHGGGVAFFVSEQLDYHVILCGPNQLQLLLISVSRMNHPNNKFHVGVWYRPPDNREELDTLFLILQSIDISIFSRFLLIGDFNINVLNTQHSLFYKLEDMMDSLVLTQVVPGPTHISPSGKQSLLDLALLSNPELLEACSTISPLGNSDHDGIAISLSWSVRASTPTNSRTIWRYEYAKFESAKIKIRDADWTAFYNENNINKAWEQWFGVFMLIMNESIPQKNIIQNYRLPWINQSIRNAISMRNSAFSKAKRNGNILKYKQLRNKVVQLLRIAKKKYLKKASFEGSKRFWKAVKNIRNPSNQSIPVLREDSIVATSNAEKASLLNKTLARNFNYNFPVLSPPNIQEYIIYPTSEVLCSEDEVFSLLCTVDVSKASGPDGISGYMLKGTAEAITPTLTQLFNLSLKTGTVHKAWKASSVVPIPKLNKPSNNPNDYRHISLLPIVSKLLEKHVYKLLWDHLTNNEFISDSQWGFCPNKSTVTALLSTFHAVYQMMEKDFDVSLIFLDIRKAFDSVPHQPLIQYLGDIGINPHIVQWISSYLCQRTQRVVVGGASSDAMDVVSGVPQGSVLGPLLFLTYINCVANLCLSEGTRLSMYADDILLWKPIKQDNDYIHLQADLNLISSSISNLHLSPNATSVIWRSNATSE